jgi:hypothetical protein
VFVDKDAPSHVLESYTFSFKYTGAAGDVNNRLASVSLETVGCTAEMKTMRTVKLGLEMIIRRLITLSAFLPILPSMQLVPSEDLPWTGNFSHVSRQTVHGGSSVLYRRLS